MKLVLFILLFVIVSFSKPIIFDVCKDWCFQYEIEDMKTWKWMTNEVNGQKFIRITLFGNKELDLNVGDYAVKVRK